MELTVGSASAGVIDEYGIREEAVDKDGVSTVISNSGIYTFTLGVDGSKVQARFTYVYKKIGDEWKILSHHSSQLPTKLTPSPFTGTSLAVGTTSLQYFLFCACAFRLLRLLLILARGALAGTQQFLAGSDSTACQLEASSLSSILFLV